MAKKRVNDTLPGFTHRVIIEDVKPCIDSGRFPVKRIPGQKVKVSAAVFSDGHHDVSVQLLFKRSKDKNYKYIWMAAQGNDLFEGEFTIEEFCDYSYTVRGFVDPFANWHHDFDKKRNAGADVTVDLLIGYEIVKKAAARAKGSLQKKLRSYTQLLKKASEEHSLIEEAMDQELFDLMQDFPEEKGSVTYPKELKVMVERDRALFSSWYEFFPRSWSKTPGRHGTFKDAERILPEIADMGFDIVYLPPIHPIGETNRKGKNNSVVCRPGEPGCPWAIGGRKGGHKALNPELGTMKDFAAFIKKTKSLGMEVAMDIAFQCSPDHPYVKEHPQWFKWRPDGTVQYAENPPKKYEDVLPINFDTGDWKNLWEELKSVVEYWAGKGVRVFRVDNPHTKPFEFWDWLIAQIKKDYPDVIFLSEAFTRPHIMYRLAKGGFSQSYTYFTWRYTKREFSEYLTELSSTEVSEYCRPNFWPNTPDILPGHLQNDGRASFIMRAVMAATMSSNFGIYGPVYELCVSQAVHGKEEYADSEKYEIRSWDWNSPGNIKDVISELNRIRKANKALQQTNNIVFCEIDNPHMVAFYKYSDDKKNVILVVVNLDPFHKQSGFLHVPIFDLGINPNRFYIAKDLLSGREYEWKGEVSYVELDPQHIPAHIIRMDQCFRPELDF